MSQGPEIDQTYVLQSAVDSTRTALALAANGEALPDVFATPFMIADMERACAAILHPYLKEGEVSVGARIEVVHTAPTPVGSPVTATATFTAREGALYWFDVVAEDPGGRIGRGRIARAIVDQSMLMSTAGARKNE
ncbi:MAG: thioesterase [Pseudomonadota bacterium]